MGESALIQPAPASEAVECRICNANGAQQNCAHAQRNPHGSVPDLSGAGDQTMRTFEAVASTVLAFAAQALVVGVVVTTF